MRPRLCVSEYAFPVIARVRGKHLFTFLRSLLQTSNQISPQNMKIERFLKKKNLFLSQFSVINSWAVHLSDPYC